MTTRPVVFEILLVEDNPSDFTIVREALNQNGVACSLHVMTVGAQAIALIDDLKMESAGELSKGRGRA